MEDLSDGWPQSAEQTALRLWRQQRDTTAICEQRSQLTITGCCVWWSHLSRNWRISRLVSSGASSITM